MKNIILSGLIITMLLASCEKDFMSEGMITGADLSMCASICCSGWLIDIDNKTYRFWSLPEYSGLNLLEDNYPIYVNLDWSKNKGICEDAIVVKRIQKI